MDKGVPKELRREIRSVLAELVNGEPGGIIPMRLNMDSLRRDAINYLDDIGAFENVGTSGYRVTAFGREYWDKLNTWDPWYWFTHNVFPTTVAFATIATSASGIIFNALD